jgi:hypothetical protein
MAAMTLSPQERERLEREASILGSLVDAAKERSDNVLLQVASGMLDERLTALEADADSSNGGAKGSAE